MTAFSRFALGIAALAVLAGAPALAQAAPATSRPAAVASAAALKPAPGRWTCVTRATIEIAPVSFDTYGNAETWVMVHRIKGEIIAAERIGKQEVDRLRAMPCNDQGGVSLVG